VKVALAGLIGAAALAAGLVLLLRGGDDRRRSPAATRPDRAETLTPAATPRPPRRRPPVAYAPVTTARVRKDLRGLRPRVYVPNSDAGTVDVISQRTGRVVDHFAVGQRPQHVTPSWDLRTLWVTNNDGNTLTPIDARSGRHGHPVPVEDPYNLYFTADGRRAIVVAERLRRLDFRSPRSMRLRHQLPVPQCPGVDHMDFTGSGRRALVSCEFAGRMIVVDLVHERVARTIPLRAGAMPQDVKLSPDGRTFYVADMASGGVWVIDARTWRVRRLQATGRGAHGLYPSRDSRFLYVSNRDEGSVSVLSFRTTRPVRKWHIPGGGSPDMGGVSANGRVLWLTGRYDAEIYALSTRTGRLLHRVQVGAGPHGACVWPQPGRYSIGHTGILR
jgi:DNA-binding beta-propeller fold protein YncE